MAIAAYELVDADHPELAPMLVQGQGIDARSFEGQRPSKPEHHYELRPLYGQAASRAAEVRILADSED